MPRYTPEQINQALADFGFNRTATPQDIANAQKFGLGIFQATAKKQGFPMTPEDQFARRVAGQLFPEQQAIPSFESSGLYNPEDTTKLFESYYDPYFAKLTGGEEEKKRLAQEAMGRALGRLGEDTTRTVGQAQEDTATRLQDIERQFKEAGRTLGNTAAVTGQLGSGVMQREQGLQTDEVGRQRAAVDRAMARIQQGATTAQQRGTEDVQRGFATEYDNPYGSYAQRKEQIKNQQGVTRAGFLSDEENRARTRWRDRFNTTTT